MPNRTPTTTTSAASLSSVSLPPRAPSGTSVSGLEETLSGRNFEAQLTTDPVPASPGYVRGTFQVLLTTQDGRPLALYRTAPNELEPPALAEARRKVRMALPPEGILEICVKALVQIEGIALSKNYLSGPAPYSAEISSARHVVPTLEQFCENPSCADNRFSATRLDAAGNQETMSVDVLPQQSLLLVTLSPQGPEHSAEEPLRFCVPLKASLYSEERELRANLIRAARFLFDSFAAEGLEETASLLQRSVLPADSLPADERTLEANSKYILNGHLPSSIKETVTIASTGTVVDFASSLRAASIHIRPPQWADRDLAAVAIFEPGVQGSPFSAAELSFIKKAFSLLSSESLSDRKDGVRMLNVTRADRAHTLEEGRQPSAGEENIGREPPPLLKALVSMSMQLSRCQPMVNTLVPKPLLDAAFAGKLQVTIDPTQDVSSMMEFVAGSLSRSYSLVPVELRRRRELFQTLRVTEHFGGGISIEAGTWFGGVLRGQLRDSEGMSQEDREQLEAELISALGSQGSAGYVAFQEACQSLIDEAGLFSVGDPEEILTNIPPLSDKAAVQALQVASQISRQTGRRLPDDSSGAVCRYQRRGHITLAIPAGGPRGNLELVLSGDRLERVVFTFLPRTEVGQPVQERQVLMQFLAKDPVTLSGEVLSEMRLALESYLDQMRHQANPENFLKWISTQKPLMEFLARYFVNG